MVRLRFLTVVGLALLLVAPGYVKAQQATPPATPSKGLESKAEQAAPPAKSYTSAEKQAYQKKTAVDLKELQGKVDDLKMKSRTVMPQRKRTALRMMIYLQNKDNVARNQLTALEKAPEKDWSKLKADMDTAMAELTKAYAEVEARLE